MESIFKAIGCWLGIVFARLTGPPPFKMHFDFRPLLRRTFAELSRKYPYPPARMCFRLGRSLTFGDYPYVIRKISFIPITVSHMFWNLLDIYFRYFFWIKICQDRSSLLPTIPKVGSQQCTTRSSTDFRLSLFPGFVTLVWQIWLNG